MTHFRHFAARMWRWPGRLILALLLAAFSAIGLGVGLLSLGPVLSLILSPEHGQSLPDLAATFNQAGHLISVPEWIIDTLPAGRFEGVLFVLVGIACLTIAGGLANFAHQYLSAWIAIHVVADVRRGTFRHVLTMELGRVLRRGPSEFVARIVRDAEALQAGLIVLLGRSVAQLTKGLAAFVAACVFDIRLVLIAVIVLPIMAIVLRKIGNRVRRSTADSLAAQQDLLRIASEAVQGIRAVKVNTAEEDAERRFDEANRRVVAAELRVRLVRALASPLVETLAIVVLGSLAAIAARSIIAGSLDFDQFLLSIGSLGVAGAALRPLTGLVAELQGAEAPAARLQEVLDLPLEQGAGGKVIPRHAGTIVFDDISFAYNPEGEDVLSHCTLTIEHGERVAFVGPNGSGKTTLISLLPRLLRPQTGRLLVDGIDVAEADIKSLREQIGVVTQETVLFRGTIRDNIAFGSDADAASVEEAAKQAHAHEFVSAIPGAYDADVQEQGTSLSGGQRQRLAIARALLRDPAILILDEATSQIDAESETMINDTLSRFCAGRTVLLIAHRLSTVQTADRIVVLDAGDIVADGTHASLLDSCSIYARLVQTQMVPASEKEKA